MEAVKKQSRDFENVKAAGSDEKKALQEEMTTLKAKFKQLESELQTKNKGSSFLLFSGFLFLFFDEFFVLWMSFLFDGWES